MRKQGLKLGVANHGIENFEFINPPAELAERMKAKNVDLYDPKLRFAADCDLQPPT